MQASVVTEEISFLQVPSLHSLQDIAAPTSLSNQSDDCCLELAGCCSLLVQPSCAESLPDTLLLQHISQPRDGPSELTLTV
jgi:hypothetical protein